MAIGQREDVETVRLVVGQLRAEPDLLGVERDVVARDVGLLEAGHVVAAQRLELAVRGGRRELHEPRARDVRGVLEDVAGIVAAWPLKDDERVDRAQGTGGRVVVAVATDAGAHGGGQQAEAERDGLHVELHGFPSTEHMCEAAGQR